MGDISVGQLVRVQTGVLTGIVGEVIRSEPNGKLLIVLEMQHIAILIDEARVQPMAAELLGAQSAEHGGFDSGNFFRQ